LGLPSIRRPTSCSRSFSSTPRSCAPPSRSGGSGSIVCDGVALVLPVCRETTMVLSRNRSGHRRATPVQTGRAPQRSSLDRGPAAHRQHQRTRTARCTRPRNPDAACHLWLRGGEVRGLRLEDLDWDREVITIKRPKQRKTQYYPVVESVGTAILNYLQWARPGRCASRDLFVTLKAPFRRLRRVAFITWSAAACTHWASRPPPAPPWSSPLSTPPDYVE
jgi:hypothetical protein